VTAFGDQVAPELGDRRVDALVAVDRRVEQRAQGSGVLHDAAEEVIGELRQAERVARVEEQVLLAGGVPHRDMGMAAVAGQVRERLGHEGGAVAMVLGDGLDHVLEEHVAIGGDQRVVVIPVHFELAVGVFMVVLVRAPAEFQHGVADLADHRVASHQGLLVVAGLVLPSSAGSDRLRPSGEVRKNSHSTPVFMR
jgi:hypothetical protein